MIVPYQILKDLFVSDIEAVKAFHYGSIAELKKYMDIKAKENIYPLGWVELPLQRSQDKIDGSYRELPINMFIATTTRKDWLNHKREIETFGKVLRPIYDEFKKQAVLSKHFEFVGREIEPNELHNFHTSDFSTFEQSNEVNAYWDVISISFTGRFNNNCKK